MNFSLNDTSNVMKFSLVAHAEAALPANEGTVTYGLLFSEREQVYLVAKYDNGQLVGYAEP